MTPASLPSAPTASGSPGARDERARGGGVAWGGAVAAGVDGAVRWLRATQHRDGSWTDFLLTPGPSDAWVTAFVGLAAAPHAPDLADRAVEWLLRAGPDGVWGWTGRVRPDADSTAWAARLLAARGATVPAATHRFLDAHRAGDGGYRTYRSAADSGAWATEAAPEVTAAVVLARRACGLAVDPVTRAALDGDGPWRSPWWDDDAYPAAIVGEARRALGTAPSADGWAGADPRTAGERGAWGLATRVWARAARRVAADPSALLAARRADGGWGGTARLRVPRQHGDGEPRWTHDARGVFTTATALHALTALLDATRGPGDALPTPRTRPTAPPMAPGVDVARERARLDPRGLAARGEAARAPYDRVVADMARAAGVDAGAALPAFRALTAESLARHGVWPSSQLSTLAGGTPLEFSVGARPALRWTTEVGDPLLAPHARLRTGLAAVERTAGVLGLRDAWHAAQPALRVLADDALPVPDGSRFWLWAGVDVTPGHAVLKSYVSLHADAVPGWRARERAFLAAAGVPATAQVHDVLDVLARHGFCHEAGVGAMAGGRWGIKVYYELDGYRPALVRDVLALCGLPTDLAGVEPEIPGVLRASLAAKRRAGIAIRVRPGSGRVDEVTVAAAFPEPLVGRDALAERVSAWLPDPGSHDAAVAALRPGWRGAEPGLRMHSLFTRSRSAWGDEDKVYVRPLVRAR